MNQKTLVIYLSPYDILRPRTNQVSDVRFSEGFSQNDCEVHLITPFVYRDDNISKEDINKVYGLESPVTIHYLPTKFKKDISGKISSYVVSFLACREVIKILKTNSSHKVYIISRSAFLTRAILTLRKLFFRKFKNAKIIFWAHDFKNKDSFVNVYKDCDILLATNSSIINDICKSTSKPPEKTFVTLNPITKAQASFTISKKEARAFLGLDNIQQPLLVYTGKVAIDYNEEFEYILKAVKLSPQIQFLCTGGKPEAINYWKDWCAKFGIKNAIFTGYISDYSKIKYYQFAADMLISYYTHQGHDIRYNLPNKICEYMLSGNIIITPDYAATSDLLNNNNCCFTIPENENELAKSIQDALIFNDSMKLKADNARKQVQQITFKNRCQMILNFLN